MKRNVRKRKSKKKPSARVERDMLFYNKGFNIGYAQALEDHGIKVPLA